MDWSEPRETLKRVQQCFIMFIYLLAPEIKMFWE